jgi:hypothetical protein
MRAISHWIAFAVRRCPCRAVRPRNAVASPRFRRRSGGGRTPPRIMADRPKALDLSSRAAGGAAEALANLQSRGWRCRGAHSDSAASALWAGAVDDSSATRPVRLQYEGIRPWRLVRTPTPAVSGPLSFIHTAPYDARWEAF